MMKEEKGVAFILNKGSQGQTEITIPEELLKESGIGIYKNIEIVCGEGQILISGYSILDDLPAELLEFYDTLGISREVVEAVLEQELFKNEI